MPKLCGLLPACYQYILFIIVEVKSIREKIITTTYYVCMSTAFIKGSRTLLDSHIAHSSRLFSTISQSQKEWIENLSLWSKYFAITLFSNQQLLERKAKLNFFFRSRNIHADFSST